MCRKNLTRLTLAEKQAFTNAVVQLRANGQYDKYVRQHEGAMQHGHGGPAFFPWHREFLRRFEDELQAIDPSVYLPYWDWTVENLNASGTASLIWADDFMGGPGDPANGFRVTNGPFASWNLVRGNFNIFAAPGGGGAIAGFMASPSYAVFDGLESPHGAAHGWVGGFVGNALIAPRDPVFWLIHANVDRLWAEWTNTHRSNPSWVQYAPTTGGPAGHNLNDSMWPWNGTANPFPVQPYPTFPEQRRPADLLEHRDHGYFYDTIDPECQRIRPVKPLKDAIDGGGKRFAKDLQPKEIKENLKERMPKELKETIKENIKENVKERLPKERIGDKPIKERGPKELKDMREDPKRIVEGRPDFERPFILEEMRPDLVDAPLAFEQDIANLRGELQGRLGGLGGGRLGPLG
jgi:tyrosinase